jgi:hypothetical protein
MITGDRFFALAAIVLRCDKDDAFQASSPKTTRLGWQRPGLFF